MPIRSSRRARRASVADNVIGIRLADPEVEALDAEVERLRRESPEAGHASRGSVIRGLVQRHLANRRPAAPSGAAATA